MRYYPALSPGLYQLILSYQNQLVFLDELNEFLSPKLAEINELNES